MAIIPQDLAELVGKPCFAQESDGAVEAGAIRLFAAAVEDGFPAYWADDPAQALAPPALLSAWNRPLMWHPGEDEAPTGLALHFLLKDRLGLPRAVVTETESEVSEPIRPGARVRCEQILVELGDLTSNRLGEGRYWTIRVEYRCACSHALFGAETLRFFGYGAGLAA